jgi:hypothetical protein
MIGNGRQTILKSPKYTVSFSFIQNCEKQGDVSALLFLVAICATHFDSRLCTDATHF